MYFDNYDECIDENILIEFENTGIRLHFIDPDDLYSTGHSCLSKKKEEITFKIIKKIK